MLVASGSRLASNTPGLFSVLFSGVSRNLLFTVLSSAVVLSHLLSRACRGRVLPMALHCTIGHNVQVQETTPMLYYVHTVSITVKMDTFSSVVLYVEVFFVGRFICIEKFNPCMSCCPLNKVFFIRTVHYEWRFYSISIILKHSVN